MIMTQGMTMEVENTTHSRDITPGMEDTEERVIMPRIEVMFPTTDLSSSSSPRLSLRLIPLSRA